MTQLPKTLQFGIPSLDMLLGYSGRNARSSSKDFESDFPMLDELGISLRNSGSRQNPVTVCLVGPEGTGKSAVTLHMVSRFAADTIEFPDTKIIYASTDFSHAQAMKFWEGFNLKEPNKRSIPFLNKMKRPVTWNPNSHVVDVQLVEYLPSRTIGDNALANYILNQQILRFPDSLGRQRCECNVAFLNLQEDTAGDDWSFLNRILSLLPEPGPESPPHLFIIDAVEGLESLEGDIDSYGQIRTRRSRIAQLVRSAGEKCHLVFVVEEKEANKRLDEEFLADAVLRFRYDKERGRRRNTVEIEKVRSQAHIPNEHPIVLRDGHGTTTGVFINPDHPLVSNAYAHVFHSIQHLAANISRLRGEIRRDEPIDQVADFGIRYLDDMLRYSRSISDKRLSRRLPERGLPCGTITALIGDEGTQKSLIGRSFLAQHFVRYAEDLKSLTASDYRGWGDNDVVRRVLSGIVDPVFIQSQATRVLRAFENKYINMMIEKSRDDSSSDYLKGEEERLYRDQFINSRTNRQNEIKERFEAEKPERIKVLEDAIKEKLIAFVTQLTTAGVGRPASGDFKTQILQSIKDLYGLAESEDIANVPEDAVGEAQLKAVECAEKGLIEWNVTDDLKAAVFGISTCLSEWEEQEDRSQSFGSDTPTMAFRFLRLLEHVFSDFGVSLYLTTKDENVNGLGEMFLKHVLDSIDASESLTGLPEGHFDIFCQRLREVINARTICRRFDIDDASSATLLHVVRECVNEAQRRIFFGTELDYSVDRYEQSWRIRLVVEDLRTLRDIYPEVANDTLFLPFLHFYLRREGITTIMVDTQPGRPDMPIERFESEVRILADNRIYVWRVDFMGQKRVALAAIPPIQFGLPVLIRELRWQGIEGDDQIVVDPHFELYAGLDQGAPEMVPLRVRLYGETPAVTEYASQLNDLLRTGFHMDDLTGEIVSCGDSAPVIEFNPARAYEQLRDFCFIRRGMALNHTLIYAVDEFWSMRRRGAPEVTSDRSGAPSGLRVLTRYLFDEATYRTTEGQDRIIDPFSSYQRSQNQVQPEKDLYRCHFFSEESAVGGVTSGTARMKLGEDNHSNVPDRLPFTWNFGFLMCRKRSWLAALNELLPRCAESKKADIERVAGAITVGANVGREPRPVHQNAIANAVTLTDQGFTGQITAAHSADDIRVLDVWAALAAASGQSGGFRHLGSETDSDQYRERQRDMANTFRNGLLSWRIVLEACVVVAGNASLREGKEVVPFDLSLLSTESLSSLVLEMWTSEMLISGIKLFDEPADLGLKERQWTFDPNNSNSLANWLKCPKCKLALYRVIILLAEVLKSNAPLMDGHFRVPARKADTNAIASRHWYTSATFEATDGDLDDPLVPLTLPGSFSTRGDWFLAVASGSRSFVLAHRALDILTSRRSNAIRFESGVGLPTRNEWRVKDLDEIRSGLVTVEDRGSESENPNLPKMSPRPRWQRMSYREILDIGPNWREDSKEQSAFRWLWRSGLANYDREARVWQMWLSKVLSEFVTIHFDRGSEWTNGFTVYDRIPKDAEYDSVDEETKKLKTYNRFRSLCDQLLGSLGAVTIPTTPFASAGGGYAAAEGGSEPATG